MGAAGKRHIHVENTFPTGMVPTADIRKSGGSASEGAVHLVGLLQLKRTKPTQTKGQGRIVQLNVAATTWAIFSKGRGVPLDRKTLWVKKGLHKPVAMKSLSILTYAMLGADATKRLDTHKVPQQTSLNNTHTKVLLNPFRSTSSPAAACPPREV